jgi:hypothetical protein
MAISGQLFSKHIPKATDMNATIEQWCFLCGPYQDVISKGQSELIESSAWEAVKIEPECVKLKNLYC